MGRLIDADVLIENLREIKTLYGVPMTNRDEQMIHWIIGHIKEQPTAYDVSRVVAELEQLPTYEFGVSLLNAEKYIKLSDLKNKIEIVRKGGVDV